MRKRAMVRPCWDAIVARTIGQLLYCTCGEILHTMESLYCTCGEILHTMESVRTHWQSGHFDFQAEVTMPDPELITHFEALDA